MDEIPAPSDRHLDETNLSETAGPNLTSAQQVFSLLVDAVEDYAIFALDPEGVILTWNAGGLKLKGYRADEVIGTNFSRFYSREDVERRHPQNELKLAAENGKYEEEGWRVKKDGSLFWANVVITALRDAEGVLRGFGKVTRDLTEKKNAEISLKESEEKFRLLVSNVVDYVIITLDTSGVITSWNTGAQRIKGYLPQEILGKHFSIFYPPSEIENGKPEMELRIAADEGRYEEEGWRVRKDGSMFWANVTITAMYAQEAEGPRNLKGFAKVTRDLTSRRQSEEALRQSQERYRLLVENITDYALILLDSKGRVTSWNAGAIKISGYTSKEILGSHFSKFYSAEDLAAGKPARELRIAAETGRYEEEGQRLRKDGTVYWASVVITCVKDELGNVRGYSKVTRDITEKREIERQLRESEERFRLMVEGVEDYAIFMLDRHGFVATWNGGAERTKGYSAQEIIGKHFSIFYGVEDIQSGKPAYEIKEAMAKGRFEDEGWRLRKDGTQFWANVIITAVYDGKKNLVGFSKITRNLSERKKAEDALKASFSALETRVKQRTHELFQEKTKAEKAVAARDQFFSMASHELKTPLSSLKMQVQLRKRSVMKGDFSDFKTENLLELCEDDERQVNRLVYLVDNMLDVSRLTSGTFELTYKDTNVSELIDGVLKIMSSSLLQTGNTWTVDCPKSIHGEFDQTRIEQVLTNLLSNCGKYAPGRPIQILVTEQPHTICIKVRDEGPGIPDSEHERLFKPFERLAHSEASGLGLGLFIIKQIVDAHRGYLELSSELGKGTTLTMSLPSKRNEIAGHC